MKESSRFFKTLSNRPKEDNDMSAVPLMTLHSSKRGAEETHDSDQMSDEDDPLESVLARMKYRPQNYRSQDFWSSVMFSGSICFVVGFVVSYIVFLSIDQNNRMLQTIEHDANPQIATALLQEISASEINKFINDLSKSRSRDSPPDLIRANKVRNHFQSLGFDTVSEVFPSKVTLSFYDVKSPNLVMILREKSDTDRMEKVESDRDLFGIKEHNYLLEPDKEGGFLVQTHVQGTVVYVNFGRESDFQYLRDERSDVGVRGNILLARVGKVEPVELVHRCLEKGAIGVILFADPQQYPDSMNKNRTFLSPTDLGSLQSMHGNLATSGANHSGCVPVLTISATDAEYIFREMSSSEASPENWRGNMSVVNYPIGPGFSVTNSELRMEVSMVNVHKTYHSVTGGLRGSHEPDRYVLLGSSHTSFTGKDTLGATAAMLEVAQVLSKLNSKTGWRPRRSIIFCSWGFSSEEGSVSSIPLNDDWLISIHEKAVVYLGMEVAVRGNRSLSVSATPLLSQAVYEASTLVPNPGTTASELTMFESWLKSASSSSDSKKPRIHNVAGEGNFQSFLRDLGIPSLDLHFGDKEAGDSSYEDSDFRYHKALTQLWAILTWKMTDSLLVPFDVNHYASFLKESVKGITAAYSKEVTKSLTTIHLENAVLNFSVAADSFHNKMDVLDKSNSLSMRIMNDQQMQLERAFLHYHKNQSSHHSRHVLFSSGASINTNPSLGFGELQDMLDDLSTSPVAGREKRVNAYIESLIHCINNAAHSLLLPFQPPALSAA